MKKRIGKTILFFCFELISIPEYYPIFMLMKTSFTFLLLFLVQFSGIAQQSKSINLLIGTYTSGKSEGIYVYKFNTQSGDAKYKNKATGVSNPSFLTVSPDKKHVFAVNENASGEVSSFAFTPQTGALKFINKVPSEGAHPCYITADKTGKNVIVGNYSGGTLAVLPVGADGSLGKSIQTIHHEGKGPNKERQEKAHVHSTVFSPDYKYLLVGDLGIDKAVVYRYDAKKAASPLTQAIPPFAALEGGSGPRHIAFHPNNKYVYVVQELTAKVTGLTYKDGKLTPFQTVSLIPNDFKGQVGAADIHVSPDGRFLYASNRGDANDISIFAISADGKLKFVGRQSTLGKSPRNFSIDPTGNFLVVANQETDNIVIFKRDKKTGLLKDTGKRIDVGKPVCLVFSSI